jgi:hypothetical protein
MPMSMALGGDNAQYFLDALESYNATKILINKSVGNRVYVGLKFTQDATADPRQEISNRCAGRIRSSDRHICAKRLSRPAENYIADSIDMLNKILIPDCFVVDYIYKIGERQFFD